MDKLVIKNNGPLSGSVTVGKAKNSLLPLMASVLLLEGETIFQDVPHLRDINTLNELLQFLGVSVERKKQNIHYQLDHLKTHEAPYDLVRTMRASICVLGPLLTRFHRAKVSLPGGCAIGSRPIDLHLSNLERMGAEINIVGGYVEARCEGLKGCDLLLDFPSVGATENLMMAATLASGVTVIKNAALEPEVVDLGHFLNKCGARIEGLGTNCLRIEGVKGLKGVHFEPIGDRIEAATFIIAALMTKSELTVKGFNPVHLESVIKKLVSSGANIENREGEVHVKPSILSSFNVETAPFPAFPTDVQAQMMALATCIKGTSIIKESIFENRFMHVPELIRMGAKINLNGNTAIIDGNHVLTGAPVMCTDLRASAALVLAGLVAEKETEVKRVYHLDRGYEKLEEKLRHLGADIKREQE